MAEGYREEMSDGTIGPEGREYLELCWEQEDRCELVSDEWLLKAGLKAPKCLETLGTVLSLLDRVAGCWWGCRGGDHIVERLVARAYNSARAALRLVRGGFYDEALSCVRSIGELGNLLMLFRYDKGSFQIWTAMDDKRRKNAFGAIKVRKKLETIGAPLAVDEDIYRQLSGVAVHATPDTNPQSFNPSATPVIGSHFQHPGALTVLNELAFVITFVAAASPDLVGLEDDKRTAMLVSARNLAESVGDVGIMNVRQLLEELGGSPA